MSNDGYTYRLIWHEGFISGDTYHVTYERRLELVDATIAEALAQIKELQARPDVIRVALARRPNLPGWETLHSGPGALIQRLLS